MIAREFSQWLMLVDADILFIYISCNPLSWFSLLEAPIPSSLPVLLYRCSHTHRLLPPHLDIPLHWGMEPSQDQGPLLSLMPDKAILCYVGRWSLGSFHVYSLDGGLVPVSSGGGDLSRTFQETFLIKHTERKMENSLFLCLLACLFVCLF